MPPEQQTAPVQVVQAPASQPQALPIGYAGFWIRFLAVILDGLVLLPIVILLDIVIFGTVNTSNIGASALQVVIQWTYYIAFTHYNQATVGKRLLGLYVVSEDGTHLSLGRIIFRETIGKIISIIILGIGYMMAGFTGKKQALHDKMVGSIVVSNPNNRKTWAFVVSIILAAILPIIAAVGIFASITLASLNTAREKGADAGAKANLASIRAYAEIAYEMSYDEASKKGSYAGVCEDATIKGLITQAEGYAKTFATCNAEQDAYAVFIPLKSNSLSGWCTDSTGASRESAELRNATVCP